MEAPRVRLCPAYGARLPALDEAADGSASCPRWWCCCLPTSSDAQRLSFRHPKRRISPRHVTPIADRRDGVQQAREIRIVHDLGILRVDCEERIDDDLCSAMGERAVGSSGSKADRQTYQAPQTRVRHAHRAGCAPHAGLTACLPNAHPASAAPHGSCAHAGGCAHARRGARGAHVGCTWGARGLHVVCTWSTHGVGG